MTKRFLYDIIEKNEGCMFMKKLIFNEVTKELNFVEQESSRKDGENSKENNNEILKEGKNNIQENAEKSKKLKFWLENNKIFFEIFSYVFVGVMGIVISLVGLKFNETTVEIYQRQLKMDENDREPSFYSELCWTDVENMDYVYEIENRGGIAIDCLVCPVLKIVFYINDKFIYVIFNDSYSAEILEYGEKGDKQCVVSFKRSKNFCTN